MPFKKGMKKLQPKDEVHKNIGELMALSKGNPPQSMNPFKKKKGRKV
jgi:hypothetical protein